MNFDSRRVGNKVKGIALLQSCLNQQQSWRVPLGIQRVYKTMGSPTERSPVQSCETPRSQKDETRKGDVPTF